MGTELILVRHGQTTSNLLGILHGWTDVPLTEAGLRQANRVAEQLSSISGVQHIYSSPLQRARLTAQAISRRLGVRPLIRPDLVEMNFGDVEGYTLTGMERDFPDLHARIADLEDIDAAFPNGESRRDFHLRVRQAFDELIAAHLGGRLIIVSHGGVIGSGIAQLTNGNANDWQRFMVRNCSITRVELHAPNEVEFHCWDDISHLDESEGVT
ncbi:MAG TPA: histidine phosphatase family protein [Nitrolancea sp.]|nr:histidine phosphatase family protein [Nitrolancea sp.]